MPTIKRGEVTSARAGELGTLAQTWDVLEGIDETRSFCVGEAFVDAISTNALAPEEANSFHQIARTARPAVLGRPDHRTLTKREHEHGRICRQVVPERDYPEDDYR